MSPLPKLDAGSQALVKYAESFSVDEPYKLLEVDEEFLEQLMNDEIVIKGSPDDEAVLCTSRSTFAMKFVSTSNTVFLVPPEEPLVGTQSGGELDGDCTTRELGVVATVSGHIELIEAAPRLERLVSLVGKRPYRDDDFDMVDDDDIGARELYSWDELSDCVQASDFEMREELKKLGAAEIGLHWRLIEPDFMRNLLQILLSTVIQEDWSLNAIPGAEVFDKLEADGFPSAVVLSCLDKFGKRIKPSLACHEMEKAEELDGLSTSSAWAWALDEEKICLQYAVMLLQSKLKWRVEEFLAEWRVITPSLLNPNLGMLRGEALVEKMGPESWLHHFSSSLLPTRPDARFAALFRRRAKWEWQDLEPYLRDLKVPGLSVEAMLLKFTRKTQRTASSTPVYTAR